MSSGKKLENKAEVFFTNILHEACSQPYPKSTKNTFRPTVFFALMGAALVKAVCKFVDKIDPRSQSLCIHLLF